jgi:hypothetical protein
MWFHDALVKAGKIKPLDEHYANEGRKLVEDVLDDFLAEITSKAVRSDIRAILEAFTENHRVVAVGAFGEMAIKGKVRDYLDTLDDVQPRRIKEHLRALHRFAQWLEDEDMIEKNFAAKVNRSVVKGDDERVVPHEGLWPSEVERLCAGRHGLYYRFRIWTGFRAETAGEILCSDLDLGGEIPSIRIRKEIVKNRVEATLPLAPTLAAMLKQNLGMRLSSMRIFPDYPMLRWDRLAALREDLTAANIENPKINHRSFRMTHQTYFRAAGVDDNTIGTLRLDSGAGTQKLRRHNYSDYRQLLNHLRGPQVAAEAWYDNELSKRKAARA